MPKISSLDSKLPFNRRFEMAIQEAFSLHSIKFLAMFLNNHHFTMLLLAVIQRGPSLILHKKMNGGVVAIQANLFSRSQCFHIRWHNQKKKNITLPQKRGDHRVQLIGHSRGKAAMRWKSCQRYNNIKGSFVCLSTGSEK